MMLQLLLLCLTFLGLSTRDGLLHQLLQMPIEQIASYRHLYLIEWILESGGDGE